MDNDGSCAADGVTAFNNTVNGDDGGWGFNDGKYVILYSEGDYTNYNDINEKLC